MQTGPVLNGPTPRRLVAVAIVVAVAAAGSGCRGDDGGTARPATTAPVLHATPAGYDVPRRLTPAAPGALIAMRDARSRAEELGAGRAWQVLYHSTDVSDRDIAVSAMVLVPKGHAPARGWPLVAWAHGTSGLADKCAPSIAPGLGNDKSAVAELEALLAQHLAIVASDYPGLGTPGTHTYLIGAADARAVIDSVTAAHALLGHRISDSWLTVGHSEGGQTALFVAQAADERAPRSRFLGTVALAPASMLDVIIPFAEATQDPIDQAYLMYALVGLSAVDAGLDVEPLLTPQARALFADTKTGCIDDITNDFAARHIDRLLDVDKATTDQLSAALGHYDNPDQAPADQPIFITQGTTDRDVPAAATDGLVTHLCGLDDRVEYKRYPGLDHNNLVAGSQPDVNEWIAARFAHRAAPTTCPTAP